MNIHLLDTKDVNAEEFTLNTLIMTMSEIDMYVEFAPGGAASTCTKTDEEMLSYSQVPFESEIYARIDNAIAFAPVTTEAERIFKGQLVIMKALIADKNQDNEI